MTRATRITPFYVGLGPSPDGSEEAEYSGEDELDSGMKVNGNPGRRPMTERSDAGLLIVQEVFGFVKDSIRSAAKAGGPTHASNRHVKICMATGLMPLAIEHGARAQTSARSTQRSVSI